LFQVRPLRELRKSGNRVEGEHKEEYHQCELQGLWTQLHSGHAPQAHHLHCQGKGFGFIEVFAIISVTELWGPAI